MQFTKKAVTSISLIVVLALTIDRNITFII